MDSSSREVSFTLSKSLRSTLMSSGQATAIRVPMSWGTHECRLLEKNRPAITNLLTRPKPNTLAATHGVDRYLIQRSMFRPSPIGQYSWTNGIVADQLFICLLRCGGR